MTGHRPHPGVGVKATGERIVKIPIERITEALGVSCEIVDPFNLKHTLAKLSQSKGKSRPAALIFQAPCALLTLRDYRVLSE